MERLKPLLLKDLRNQCRSRGLNPGGSRETLIERLQEHMLQTGDMTLVASFDSLLPSAGGVANQTANTSLEIGGTAGNNYTRPEGQNAGNFITDRPTSRVLAPPGGGTSFSFGDGGSAPAQPPPKHDVGLGSIGMGASALGFGRNNYARPEGQNVGNFLSERPSSRVLAPPGGGSQVSFG
ncbi:hypothetical protein H632_c1138p1 [Helicosporidium sp. ATCC 50920]|nr:hypothetical protein H632_c1138p1 [Helicosporidium sp. ATCC 50920]|eukprot:KDD74680.1 hypothetical protein H632_c1138p1 [Helicosporidium sp. ATCC 50920]